MFVHTLEDTVFVLFYLLFQQHFNLFKRRFDYTTIKSFEFSYVMENQISYILELWWKNDKQILVSARCSCFWWSVKFHKF